MLRRLRRAVHWARSLRHLGSRNVVGALAEIQAMEGMAPLRAYEKALKASLLLCRQDYDATEALYAEVIEETEDSDRADDKYVNLFAQYMLAEIRADAASAQALKAQAGRITCSKTMRRWLPM